MAGAGEPDGARVVPNPTHRCGACATRVPFHSDYCPVCDMSLAPMVPSGTEDDLRSPFFAPVGLAPAVNSWEEGRIRARQACNLRRWPQTTAERVAFACYPFDDDQPPKAPLVERLQPRAVQYASLLSRTLRAKRADWVSAKAAREYLYAGRVLAADSFVEWYFDRFPTSAGVSISVAPRPEVELAPRGRSVPADASTRPRVKPTPRSPEDPSERVSIVDVATAAEAGIPAVRRWLYLGRSLDRVSETMSIDDACIVGVAVWLGKAPMPSRKSAIEKLVGHLLYPPPEGDWIVVRRPGRSPEIRERPKRGVSKSSGDGKVFDSVDFREQVNRARAEREA